MGKRITIIGLAAICALALAAIGAASASATENTAFTCVAGGSGGSGVKYSDPDCTAEAAGGGFGHLAIANGTKTELKLTSTANAVLKTTIAGAAVTLESTGVECIGCTAENKGSAGAMEVFGTGGQLKFTGVTVASSPVKCEVVGGSITTTPLVVQTFATNEAKISPVTPPTLAEFTIKAKTGQTCATATTVAVTGDANGTTKGSILTVNVPLGETLKVGVNKASLTGSATVTAGVSGSGVFNPTGLT